MAPEFERAARKRDSSQALLETQKQSEQAQEAVPMCGRSPRFPALRGGRVVIVCGGNIDFIF